jgi:hypothetical protein
MVKLEEVVDEELDQSQAGPIGGEDDWDTDSGMCIAASPYTRICSVKAIQ